MRRLLTIVLSLSLVLAFATVVNAVEDNSTTEATVIKGLASMPLAFTENQGQWDEQVLFRANAGGATMWFTKDGAYYQFTRHIPRHSRESGNPVGVGQDPRGPDISDHDVGTTGVPTYKGPDVTQPGEPVSGVERWPDQPARGRQMSTSAPLSIDAAHEDIRRAQMLAGGTPPLAVGSDSLETMMIKANFVGSNPNSRMVGEEMIDYKCNYFLGNDPAKWRTDVPNYSAIVYEDIYPGIDLKYYGNGKQMEYDFIVSPGTDPSQITVRYEGAKSLSVDTAGRLVVETGWGEVIEQRPVVYQMSRGDRVSLAGEYVLKGNKAFGFGLPDGYNADLPLVIDPTVVYSTYLGGSDYEFGGYGIAVDTSGAAYVTGCTRSTDFPTVNPYQTDQDTVDIFVTKLSSSGSSLVYSTYLGGNGWDWGLGIALDTSGAAYVTGYTESTDFPTENPYQTHQGDRDAFVTKLSSSGSSLVYSTYLGGGASDETCDVAVDASGAAYVTGVTYSTDFPTVNPYQTDQDTVDAFVTKLSSSGSSLVYSTYLGGNGYEFGSGIAVDASGAAYVTGATYSTDFPTVNPYQTDQDTIDAFVTKLSSSGSSLVYSTYLGGNSWDCGHDIAVDASGAAYVTGWTSSTDFPTENPYQTDLLGLRNVFVTKLSGSGSSLVYSTFLGGSGADDGDGIAVNNDGQAYVTGYTWSMDFPTENPLQLYPAGGGCDAFVTKLSNSGSSLVYSTYLGGSDIDGGNGIAVDNNGHAYVMGITESLDFPTEDPFQSAIAGERDIFVIKIADAGNQQFVAIWRFLFRGAVLGCYAEVWGTVDNLKMPPALFQGDAIKEHLYFGIIPEWANDLDMEFSWHHGCSNRTRTKLIALKYDGRWEFEYLAKWLIVNVGKKDVELTVPTIGDSTGVIQNVYAVVDLVEWLADPRPLQDEYVIIDGECPDLPGYLIGTTPIVFDSLAGPDENPLVTTPLTATLCRDGETTVWADSACCNHDGIRGDANCDFGGPNVADLTYLVEYLFFDGPAPPCPEEGDVDGSGGMNVADLTYLVDYLFFDGPAPAACP